MDLFRGKTLLKKDGTTISADASLRNKKLICIYFAALWCPPCRTFTPLLAQAYRMAKDEGLPIEIVFVSSDRSLNDMTVYVKDHENWPSLPYGDALQPALRARYKVAGIPTLVVVKADGALVCANGRPDIQTKSLQAFKDWLTCI
ncbi:nucleoredoxin-like protein 2 [Dermacentor silvarum]|uniref:nucleoredoxin-like protein 2 n=1 Tax=Dermacentor silvarum TaxID=543639 RepID=UPI00210155DD|nr:nucleoredoxin-like protein 2 [Dermacentor silvarum]